MAKKLDALEEIIRRELAHVKAFRKEHPATLPKYYRGWQDACESFLTEIKRVRDGDL